MAYLDSTSVNTSRLATGTQDYLNDTAIDITVVSSPLLWALAGYGKESVVFGDEGSAAGFGRIGTVQGIDKEFRWISELDTINVVADGTPELAAVTPSINADAISGGRAALAHLNKHFYMTHSDMVKLAGKGAKGKAFEEEEMRRWRLSAQNAIGVAINSSNNQSGAALGGWDYAIADDNTYFDIDRNVAGNENWQANVVGSGGTLSLNQMAAIQTDSASKGGKVSLGVCGATVYNFVIDRIEDKQQSTMIDPKWTEFGGLHAKYGGVTYALDGHAPAETLGFFDPMTWMLIMNEGGFTFQDLGRDPGVRSAHVFVSDLYAGLVCGNPRVNGKLTGIQA